MKNITAAALRQRLAAPGPRPFLLDVRQPAELSEGQIPGHKMIPLGELPNRLGEIAASKQAEVIVYCRSGGRSARACEVLEAHGFTDVTNLTGGIQGWNALGPS